MVSAPSAWRGRFLLRRTRSALASCAVNAACAGGRVGVSEAYGVLSHMGSKNQKDKDWIGKAVGTMRLREAMQAGATVAGIECGCAGDCAGY